MKRKLALLLVIVMLLASVACSTGSNGGSASPSVAPPASSSPPPPSSPAETGAAKDFTAASGFALGPDSFTDTSKSYKFVFVSYTWDTTTDHMEACFKSYAESVGCEYASIASNADADVLITNIENYITQGYDGFFVNTLPSYVGRVAEICAENNVLWTAIMGIPRDINDKVIAPYVEVNNEKAGRDLVNAAIEWSENNMDGFDPAQTMFILLNLAVAEELNARSLSMESTIKERMPAAKIDLADCLAEGGVSSEIAYNMVARRLAANPDIKHWIILSPFDYLSVGACRAVEEYNVVDNACVACCNGDQYIPLLEDGTEGAWRFCLFWDNGVWAKFLFYGLYAQVSGVVKPGELWPDFIKSGESYAGLQLGTVIMDAGNYKDVLGYIDHFTGVPYFGYEWTGFEFPMISPR